MGLLVLVEVFYKGAGVCTAFWWAGLRFATGLLWRFFDFDLPIKLGTLVLGHKPSKQGNSSMDWLAVSGFSRAGPTAVEHDWAGDRNSVELENSELVALWSRWRGR